MTVIFSNLVSWVWYVLETQNQKSNIGGLRLPTGRIACVKVLDHNYNDGVIHAKHTQATSASHLAERSFPLFLAWLSRCNLFDIPSEGQVI